MSHRHLLHRFLTVLVLFSLLSSTLAPIARAQDAGPGQVFLPVVAGAAQSPNPSTSLLFRTHVTVKTPAQWRNLTRLGVTVLQQGDGWALVLADDLQVEALARLRFNPDQTNSLESLAAAHAQLPDTNRKKVTTSEHLSQLVTPSITSYFDDFSTYSAGTMPSGWTQYGTSAIFPTVVNFGGTGPTFQRLNFPAYTAQPSSKWLIKDGFTWAEVTASVKLNFQTGSDGAGLVLGWVDSGNFIAILPNPFWDEIVVWEYANGQLRSAQGTGRYKVPIGTKQDYWLKAIAGISPTGDRQIDVRWSTDGSNYTLKMTAVGLANLVGQAGVGTFQYLSHALFDEFSLAIETPQLLLDLPFDYPGRGTDSSEAFRSAFIKRTRSVFDHDIPNNDPNRIMLPYLGHNLISYPTKKLPCGPSIHECYDGHDGYDFSQTYTGEPVLAAAGGIVDEANTGWGCLGWYVTINHGNGYKTVYGHLRDKPSITGYVDSGDPIGVIGSTYGNECFSTNPHLHFKLLLNGTTVDPSGWFDDPSGDPWANHPSGATSHPLWLFSAPTQETWSINGQAGGSFTSSSGNTMVSIPPGAFSDTAKLTLTDAPVAEPSAQLKPTGHSFVLEMNPLEQSDILSPRLSLVQNTSVHPDLVITLPLTISVAYTDTDISGLEENTLALYLWDEPTSSWISLTTTLDITDNVAVVNTTMLGLFALLVADNDLQGPVIGEPTYSLTIPSTEFLTITIPISDVIMGNHGVDSATLFYSYTIPYPHTTIAGTGPGGTGDGIWVFTLPPQGQVWERHTLRFSIMAVDGDLSPVSTVKNNNSDYYTVTITVPPDADFIASPVSGVLPLTVVFTNTSTGDYIASLWDFGNGITSTLQNSTHIFTEAGEYTVTLTLSGPGGSSSKSVGITVGPAQVSVSIPLTVGWNLISLPNVAANTPVENVFAPIAGKFSIVFAYRGCDVADPWKKYDPAAPSFSNDLKTVDNTLGLWIKMTQVATLTVVGPPPTGGSIPLCTGWNLAGAPSLQTTPPVTLFSSIIAGCTSIVFAYKAADVADVWKKYDPAAPAFSNDLKFVEPGMGLWIKATQGCTWVVSGP